jgi:hypothetical protein
MSAATHTGDRCFVYPAFVATAGQSRIVEQALENN